MRKIDLIIENIRDEYMINLLEESEVSELETLKTKKFLNEALGRVRGMLIEEGGLDAVKGHLANNWGKYLAGGAAGGSLVHGANVLTGGNPMIAAQHYSDMVSQAYDNGGLPEAGAMAVGAPAVVAGYGAGDAAEQAGQGMQQIGDKLVDAAGNIYDQAGQLLGNIADKAGDVAGDIADKAGDLAGQAGEAIQNAVQ